MTRAVDASSFLGQWPFRPSWLAQAEALVAAAREQGIAACLVAPTAALLVDDPSAANAALCRVAERWPELRPVAMWNPSMPNAAAVVSAAAESGAAAVKLAPNYHRYELDPVALGPALDALERSGLVACIQLRVEDRRQARLLCPDVAIDAALSFAQARPAIRWMLCGARTNELHAAAERVDAAGNVWLGLSNADGLACLEALAGTVRPDRLLFATHMPFFYPQAARFKLVESDLAADVREALLWRNACELFGLDVAPQEGGRDG